MSWWEHLAVRQRWVLGIGGFVVAAVLIYTLIWEPWRNSLQQLRQQLAVQQQELAWMRDAAVELKRLTGNSAARNAVSRTRSLSTLIDQTAKAAGLGAALKRVEPQGEQRLRIRLEQVGFDQMVLWLSQLEQSYGVEIINAAVQREADSGRVSARLLLQEETL